MNNDAKLNVVLTAQDEASSAIKSAADNINASLNGIGDKAKSTGESLESISGSFLKVGTVMAGTGAAILAPIYAMVSAASEAQQKMANVYATLQAMGRDTPAVRDEIQKAADATLNLGFDNEEASISIAKFYQRTQDMSTAIKLNNTAMDLARAKHIDLATATTLVNQVLSGNGRVLKQYGINIKDTASPLEALGELQKQVAGQATAFAGTFAGASEVLKQQVGELMEALGAQLLPILTSLVQKVTPIIIKITEWISTHQTLVKWVLVVVAGLGALLVVVGTVVAAIGAVIGIFAVFTAAAAGPVLAVIAGIVAAIAGVVAVFMIMKTKWSELWDDVKVVSKAAWDWINTNVIQPFLNAIQKVVSAVANSPLGKAAGAVKGAVNSTVDAMTNFGHMLGFASGGNVLGGKPILVGERGPEMFIPGMSGSIVPNSGLSGGGGIAINVNINGGLITDDVAKQIGNVIVQQFKRTSRW